MSMTWNVTFAVAAFDVGASGVFVSFSSPLSAPCGGGAAGPFAPQPEYHKATRQNIRISSSLECVIKLNLDQQLAAISSAAACSMVQVCYRAMSQGFPVSFVLVATSHATRKPI